MQMICLFKVQKSYSSPQEVSSCWQGVKERYGQAELLTQALIEMALSLLCDYLFCSTVGYDTCNLYVW